jgi:CheY-like chemotaxis protein
VTQSEDPPSPSGPAAVSPPALQGIAASFRVLVADDDGMSRSVLRSMLRKHPSVLVVEAEDGSQALDIIQHSPVDAIFLDLQMPLMDGLEVLAALRGDIAYQSLPVIVLSSLSDLATVRQAIKLGITDYLVKPLRPRLMEARLHSLLAMTAKRQAATGAHTPAAPGSTVESRRRVLLVDGDAKFAAFFTGVLKADHEVVHVDNGREAARVLAGWTPEIACLGPGLRLPSELELARKLRKLHGGMLLYLCTEAPALTGEEAQVFDALLPRTIVPETFRKEFARLRAAESAGASARPGLLDDRLREDLEAAGGERLVVAAGLVGPGPDAVRSPAAEEPEPPKSQEDGDGR